MSLYCKGKDCPVREDCFRYTEGNGKPEGKGFENCVWYVSEKTECGYGKDPFYYVRGAKKYSKKGGAQ